jgi:glutathionyl-hydroquinone reductase
MGELIEGIWHQPTISFQDINEHYYGSHRWINPSVIIPIGPDLDFEVPYNRTSIRG